MRGATGPSIAAGSSRASFISSTAASAAAGATVATPPSGGAPGCAAGSASSRRNSTSLPSGMAMTTLPPGPCGAGPRPRIAARRRDRASDSCRPVSRASRARSSDVSVSAAMMASFAPSCVEQHQFAAPQFGDGAVDLAQAMRGLGLENFFGHGADLL